MAQEKILVINPGSTSTKIAVFQEETPLFSESIRHTPEELNPFPHVMDQYEYRKDLILSTLREHGVDESELTAVVSRGGLTAPIHAGAYEINEDMIWQLEYCPQHEHASNVGAKIAKVIADKNGIPAYIYDGIMVDEVTPINRLCGFKEFRRKGMGHNLNTRAAALRYARENGKDYKDITVIVAHLGGGITVNLHHNGMIEDNVNDEEGMYSPERAGGLPLFDVIAKCFEPGMTKDEMMKRVKRQGGLMSHLGTTDCQEVERRIKDGDEYAKLVYDGMALNTAKNIAKCAPDVYGKVDAVILTGGIAWSEYLTEKISQYIRFLAPVVIYPGEDEMEALALGCLRVLRGEETARQYEKTDDPWS